MKDKMLEMIHVCEICEAEIKRTKIPGKIHGTETIHDGLCKKCIEAQRIAKERGHDR